MTLIPRREFIVSGAGALATLTRAPGLLGQGVMHDLVIRGGTVFDGTGAPGAEADIAIVADRIAAVGPRLPGRGRDELDARGLAVAPGFIDIHSHADGSLSADPRAESVIRQGVTTIVCGQDGSSRVQSPESRGQRPEARGSGVERFRSVGCFDRRVEAGRERGVDDRTRNGARAGRGER
jgi:N-acyl-D-amino-acid deacylase